MSDISAFGIAATVPRGWEGRIFRRPGTPVPGTGTAPAAGGRSASSLAPDAAAPANGTAPDATGTPDATTPAPDATGTPDGATPPDGTPPGGTTPPPSAATTSTTAAPPPAAPPTTGPPTEAVSPAGGTVHPVVHVASFPLPAVRGDYGSGAVELMRTDDILVCLLEFDPEATATALFSPAGVPRLRLSAYSPTKMQRMIQGMCGAQAFFSEAGRAFGLYVVLGSFAGRAPLVPQVNELLASVRIDPLQ
jgi:hypothetical protein